MEARKIFDEGKYEEARQKAYRSERLHGGPNSYSLWDLGDRPQKVIADCQTAQAKERKKLPPLPADAVAKNETKTEPRNRRIAARSPSAPVPSRPCGNRPADNRADGPRGRHRRAESDRPGK